MHAQLVTTSLVITRGSFLLRALSCSVPPSHPDSLITACIATRPPGSFCGLRLVLGPALEAAMPLLHQRLVEKLMEDPPYELRWLKDNPYKVRMLALLTHASHSGQAIYLWPSYDDAALFNL